MSGRIIDLVAGAGWLWGALALAQMIAGWRSRRARDQAIDAKLAANRADRAATPGNRQQRRAATARQRTGGGA
jgi:hypothetical protein